MMKYKGYVGHVAYDADAKLFHGEVIGLKGIITFHGTSVEELEKAFKDSIDDYLTWCEERGIEPEKTYSGNIRVRMHPNLHAQLVIEAAKEGISLNKLITKKLSAS